jgi:hypothetical protein
MRTRSIAGWSAALLAATIVTVPATTLSPAVGATPARTIVGTRTPASTTGVLGSGTGQAAAQATANKKKKKVVRFQPKFGPTFNNPLGDGPTRYRALNVVQDAIQHARKKSIIRIMSWNIMSRSVVTYLLRAQQRGVRVLAIMDQNNLTEVPNRSFKRLRAGLRQNNKSMKLPKKRRSHAMVCVHSCRGSRGQAHSKFFLFSHTGGAHKVVMEGSMNLTAAAATNQWNDVFVLRSRKLYRFGRHIFAQMLRDKPATHQYKKKKAGSVTLSYAPERGKYFHRDPRMALLDKVHCWGAKGAGKKGRTIIRMAPDVMRGALGMRAAQRIRQLWQAGCDIRVGYTVLGRDIHRLLTDPRGRRGAVPIKHLVQDFNGDGEFDNYFHLKVLTINGHLGSNRGAHVTVQGSANLSALASGSDENIGVIRRTHATLRYEGYIEYWLNNFPKSVPTTTSARRLGPVDPYAHVDMD